MKPLVGISCCNKTFGPNGLPNHAASDFCVQAVLSVAGAIPVLLPATGDARHAEDLLAHLDGILLTGSRTNIEPDHYGAPCHPAQNGQGWPHRDPGRDSAMLPLIRAAISRGTPILAICRGMQELNVALGGSLHQCLHDIPGRLCHVAAAPEDPVGRVAPAHGVRFTSGGVLHRLTQVRETSINSLHEQGIDRLGRGVVVDAVAPDETIEAIHVANAHGFTLGIQWHPEFDADINPLSRSIFQGFRRAMLAWHESDRLAAD